MTKKQIIMPKLGESVTEGTIEVWLVKEGDHVNKYDPIAEVSTDKVNAEVPSSFTGIIDEIVAKEGETVLVDDLICYIRTEEKEEVKSIVKKDEQSSQITRVEDNQSMKTRYSPAVLRLATENDIDLTLVEGTGLGGRITRKDIEAMIQSRRHVGSIDTEKQSTQVNHAINMRHHQQDAIQKQQIGDIEIPVSGVRKVVAEHMIQAKQEIPHAWMMIEVDVTDLVKYRNKIKDQFKQVEGYNLTFFSFFVKAAAQALKEYPQLNSMWTGDKIIQKKDINLSFAVANEDELYVPVIKNADEKTVKGIARDIHNLASKARMNKLTPADIEGGTFTVNNTGSFGSIQSMGIINHPQAAILQVESITKKPVVIDDMIGIRHMVNLCLSLDHRVLDGLICGRFMARVKEILENINEKTASVF